MTNSDLRQYLHSYVCTHTHTSKQTILKNKADPLLWIPDWWVPSSGQRPVRNYPSSSLTSKGCAPGSFLPAGGVKSNGYCCDAVCYTGSAASQLYPWNLPGTGQTHPPESFLTALWELILFFFVVLFGLVFWFFWDRVSLYSPGCPGTHFVDQAGLELRNPPASASQVLGFKVSCQEFILVRAEPLWKKKVDPRKEQAAKDRLKKWIRKLEKPPKNWFLLKILLSLWGSWINQGKSSPLGDIFNAKEFLK